MTSATDSGGVQGVLYRIAELASAAQDMQTFYRAVHAEVSTLIDARNFYLALYDDERGQISWPYYVDEVDTDIPNPSEWSPFGIGEARGATAYVLRTATTQRLTAERLNELAADGEIEIVGDLSCDFIGVPLIFDGAAVGVLAVQSYSPQITFTRADEELLTFVGNHIAAALSRVQAIEETRQRNAELALITSVQEAIAGELDPQTIYDLVGDRLREVFDAQVLDIAIYDEQSDLLHYPYTIERGVRFPDETTGVYGFRKWVMDSREPLLIPECTDAVCASYGNPSVLVGERPQSVLFVPLVVGARAIGVVSLQNLDRTHAFGEGDQRLLSTVASSLGVALENARLVHETRQRVAELGTVNRVAQALSRQLELDPLIELVGEQLQETFAADIAYVALHDMASGRIDFVYYYESGTRRPEAPISFGEGLTSRILESRQPLLLNHLPHFEEHGAGAVGTEVRSYLGVPVFVGDDAIGVVSVQSIAEEGRFDDDDARLLATIAANVGVAIQNARLFSEVERQRRYLESLNAISPAAVIVTDSDQTVTDWNPAAADLFGYTPTEAIGRTIDDLVLDDAGRREGDELVRAAMTAGRAQTITRRLRKDRTSVDVELMLVPLAADKNHVGFLGIYHDVTELQRAREEAESATQAKSAFLATMSHEIRTPMNAVIGMTELLLGTDLSADQRELAEVVRVSGDALLHVIDDILDYSKIEAGKLELEQTAFNLRDCLEGTLDILAPRAWEKGIELGCLIDDAVPVAVLGDEARLRQVMLNLLSNAIKFTERGEVVVLLSCTPARTGGPVIELTVRDTGIGIPADRMDRLFASFSQVDASTTRRFGGTGLGLAISKRLIELMDGTISVTSEEGVGSTFRIALPVTAAEVPGRIGDTLPPRLPGVRILIVDDNATNREIVTRHARAWGMTPVAVPTPAEAIERLASGERFDVAVIDMMMPGMNGLGLGAELRRLRPAAELPLLLMSSTGRLPEDQWAGVFSAQLPKPFKASQLYNTLLGVLPAGDTERPSPGRQTPVEPQRAPSSSPLRILLAEDNAMNQKVALRMLGRLGCDADVAGNGLEAIAALERHPYDVVLMDVQMPELDGLGATREIRRRWPAGRPRIIAMTANALPEDREACFAAGMDDYVAKPIRGDELRAALQRIEPRTEDDDTEAAAAVALDEAALDDLRSVGGDDFVAEVVEVFLSDAPEMVRSLRAAIEGGSVEDLRRTAHTLKSNGATLGAASFAELCRTVEHRARDGALDGIADLVQEIDSAFGRLVRTLEPLRSADRQR